MSWDEFIMCTEKIQVKDVVRILSTAIKNRNSGIRATLATKTSFTPEMSISPYNYLSDRL